MKALAVFIASAVLAVIAAVALLSHMMPPGEGSFGMAKLVPLILMVLIPVCFCLIWFPANLAVWLSLTREQKDKATGTKRILAFSGTLFVLTLAVSGCFLAPQLFHRVHFYYKLEDQFGQPVSGATIRRHENFTPATGDTESESDAQGLFQESSKPGESFSLNPRKAGYALASLNANGAYTEELRQKQKLAHGAHDLIVVKMWKMQGVEPLLSFNQTLRFHYAGAPLRLDLLAGKLVESGGDLKITVNRPPGEISGRHQQDWGVRVEAIDGGVARSSWDEARVTHAAPQDGYERSDTQTASSNRTGIDVIQQMYFIQSRNGQVYSKAWLTFGINEKPDGPMSLELRGVANTNGSRNWEGDPNTSQP